MLTVNRKVPEELKIGTSEWLESDNDEENFFYFPPAMFSRSANSQRHSNFQNTRTLGKRGFQRLFLRSNLQFFPRVWCL